MPLILEEPAHGRTGTSSENWRSYASAHRPEGFQAVWMDVLIARRDVP
jgi:hypothetical protein